MTLRTQTLPRKDKKQHMKNPAEEVEGHFYWGKKDPSLYLLGLERAELATNDSISLC